MKALKVWIYIYIYNLKVASPFIGHHHQQLVDFEKFIQIFCRTDQLRHGHRMSYYVKDLRGYKGSILQHGYWQWLTQVQWHTRTTRSILLPFKVTVSLSVLTPISTHTKKKTKNKKKQKNGIRHAGHATKWVMIELYKSINKTTHFPLIILIGRFSFHRSFQNWEHECLGPIISILGGLRERKK